MTISYVQGAGNRSASTDSISVDFPGAVTTGNSICAGGTAYNLPIGTGDMSDSQTNTYTRDSVSGDFGSTSQTAIFHSFSVTGAATLTVTFNPTSSGYQSIGVGEFTATSPAVSGTPVAATGTSDTPDSGNITTDADAIIFGMIGRDGGGTITPGANYTQIAEEESASFQPYSFVRRTTVPVASGTYSVNWTFSVSHPWGVAAAAYKESGGGGGGAVGSGPLLAGARNRRVVS